MTETIFITGATGTVGQEVIREFSRRGIPVRAGVRKPSQNPQNNPLVNFVEFDYLKPDLVRKALIGVSKIFLLSPFDPKLIDFEISLLQAAQNTGIRHIVKLSVYGAHMEPGISLTRWHQEVEDKIVQSRIPYTILRPNSFMQNFLNYSQTTIQSEGKIFAPAGSGRISFIDVRDIARTVVETLMHERNLNKVYTLTGPDALDHQTVAEIFSLALKRPVVYVDVPELEARAGMAASGMPDWRVKALMELYSLAKSGLTAEVTGAVKDITNQPPIAFAQFVQDFLPAFRESVDSSTSQ